MLNRSCFSQDTIGYSASSMQLSSVVKSSEGRSGATGLTSYYNNSDAALTPKGGQNLRVSDNVSKRRRVISPQFGWGGIARK